MVRQSLKGPAVFNTALFLQSMLLIVARIIYPKYKSHQITTLIKRLPNPKEKSLFSLLEIQGSEKSNLHLFAGPSPQRSHHSMYQYRWTSLSAWGTLFSHQFNFFFSFCSAWTALCWQTLKSTSKLPIIQCSVWGPPLWNNPQMLGLAIVSLLNLHFNLFILLYISHLLYYDYFT